MIAHDNPETIILGAELSITCLLITKSRSVRVVLYVRATKETHVLPTSQSFVA